MNDKVAIAISLTCAAAMVILTYLVIITLAG